MKDKSAFQQKIKLLTKLFDFGCNTGKEVTTARHGKHFENPRDYDTGYGIDH